jgi:uncharacterized protein with FMN-binding domain
MEEGMKGMTRNVLRFLFALVACGLFSFCAAFNSQLQTQDPFALALRESLFEGYRDGIWEGVAPGYRGLLRVRVAIAEGQIQGIELEEHREDPAIGGAAMEELLDLVLEYNSADLDAVSGATESSAGFLAAVEAALRHARE